MWGGSSDSQEVDDWIEDTDVEENVRSSTAFKLPKEACVQSRGADGEIVADLSRVACNSSKLELGGSGAASLPAQAQFTTQVTQEGGGKRGMLRESRRDYIASD